MKPIVTPYDRNSRLGLKMITVNPCNQFIIQTLLRWKVKVEKQGLNQFYTYNLAVESVRKYPLPLLCYEQMKAMEGFGKFFCTCVAKMIRNHYQRGRLPTKQQKQEEDRQHEQYLRRQMKKLKNTQNKFNPNQQQGQKLKQDDDEEYSEFNDNFASQFPEGDEQQQGDNNDGQSDYSQASSSSKISKNYRPKPGCESYYILKAMATFFSTRPNAQIVSRGEINEVLFQWKMDKVRTWNKLLEPLKESGYLKIDQKDDYYLTLTTKGKDYISQAEQEETRSNQSNNITIKIFRKQQLVENQNVEKLFLLANTRGSFKSDQDFISKLTEESRYKVKQIEYELASFIWMLDQKILDYMALRFRMDNLDVQQFQTTLLRAKNSECSNIFILLQYPVESNRKLSIPKQTIAELVANSRAAGFRTVKVVGPDQSVKMLHALTDRIMQKIIQVKKGEEILMLGTLEFYNQKNKKLLPVVLKEVSRKFLKCIPRISRNSIQGLIQKYPTIRVIHDQMLRLSNNQERIQFLNWLLAKYDPKAGVNMLIVDLLYLDSYQYQPENQI